MCVLKYIFQSMYIFFFQAVDRDKGKKGKKGKSGKKKKKKGKSGKKGKKGKKEKDLTPDRLVKRYNTLLLRTTSKYPSYIIHFSSHHRK